MYSGPHVLLLAIERNTHSTEREEEDDVRVRYNMLENRENMRNVPSVDGENLDLELES